MRTVTGSPGDAHPQMGAAMSRWITMLEPITEGNRISAWAESAAEMKRIKLKNMRGFIFYSIEELKGR